MNAGPAPTKPGQAGAPVPPSISLPKGGGAIRGIGEKFAANPVTGTGSMTIPIAASAGRAGFDPQLVLSYDSGAGNGPFGFGWTLPLPAIIRKTDKGIPRYEDQNESDVFILSGADDLVSVLVQTGNGWEHEDVPPRQLAGQTYTIERYRPRVEGLFSLIERWTNRNLPSDTFWRSISKFNVTTWYGKNEESRIVDPFDSMRVYSWLICEVHDDRGNAITYEYKKENSDRVPSSLAHERHRSNTSRSANRYLKRIRYGNRKPYFPILNGAELTPLPEDWFFEVVLDYGEHDKGSPTPVETTEWDYRDDAFSNYRAGFEVRTYRLCRRVLMFHHFPESELGLGSLYEETGDYLVRSTDFTYSAGEVENGSSNPVFSFLTTATQNGYKRTAGGYLRRSLPPLQFTYQPAIVDTRVREVPAESLENLPSGLDGQDYQWIDLDGEGVAGIMTRQANGWFYKRNLSPLNHGTELSITEPARFAPLESIALQPSAGGSASTRQRFLDLASDGRVDLVQFTDSVPGFYERDDERWHGLVPFDALPAIDWDDKNLRFIDLTGDGHMDLLISEQEVFCWHASLAEEGFGAAQRTRKALDEDKGPRVVFADDTESVFLADLSGDGLSDVVRIRSGEVCYWPNLGYGRFGDKIEMDDAPWFEAPDLFDSRRIRLADIDGSGTADILYLGSRGVSIFFNRSGNSWSRELTISEFPRVDGLSSVVALDLLGNGTACLVWSSPLPSEARRAIRYIDLMGGHKPHLLIKSVNNLGLETEVTYAPSTKFYLRDNIDGKPWITKLPFPVHCVERVIVTDKWRNSVSSTLFSYHHGYFDGSEREFRGFGRVDQIDVESFGEFAAGNSSSPYITADKKLYQPPVKTVTWYHTGASLDRNRILSQFEREYFLDISRDRVGNFREAALPEPDLRAEDLTADEWRQALRACKGMSLRQEQYELDVDALEAGKHVAVRLFSTTYHNCHIRRLQPSSVNRHAVFLVTESEALTHQYDLDLRGDAQADPRTLHTFNLNFDEYGNILQSATAVYPRLLQFEDQLLSDEAVNLIRSAQRELNVSYTETRYTTDIVPMFVNGAWVNSDTYRLRVPFEKLTYELTGINPEDQGDGETPDTRDNRYFSLDELRRFRLSNVHQGSGATVTEIPYHQLPDGPAPQKRIVGRVRYLFFKEDLSGALPAGELGRLGLPYETYTLFATDELLSAVLTTRFDGETKSQLTNTSVSGYLSGQQLAPLMLAEGSTGQYWTRSGIAGYAPDAAQHFFLPERFTDPFGNITLLEYDGLDLFIRTSTDPNGNRMEVTRFDLRVQAPRQMKDINLNVSEVWFDALGSPVALASRGKVSGDNFASFDDELANPELNDLAAFFSASAFSEAKPREWLADATVRHVSYFGQTLDADGTIRWNMQPSCVCGIVREQHTDQLEPGQESRLQTRFEYSDGMGRVLVKKIQAEPDEADQPIRWITSGLTVLNNKGKPVKQYEPYFSTTAHRFEVPGAQGVTPLFYFDSMDRSIRTESPDGSFSRTDHSPWLVISHDQNDTILDPFNEWFTRNSAPDAAAEEQRAAQLAAEHAGTPKLSVLDNLGRQVGTIVHNRIRTAAGQLVDEKHMTFRKLDSQGRTLWVRDERNNVSIQFLAPPTDNDEIFEPVAGSTSCYDLTGGILFQRSMDSGDRWFLNDAAGMPIRTWDGVGHRFRFVYDRLRRPVARYVRGHDTSSPESEILFEATIYGDRHPEAAARNLGARKFQQLDSAGVVTALRYDFKGNPLEIKRVLARQYKQRTDWSPVEALLDPALPAFLNISAVEQAYAVLTLTDQAFTSRGVFDALNRQTETITPDGSIVKHSFNEANFLEQILIQLDGEEQAVPVIKGVSYNAKGQRILVSYENGAATTFEYDPKTFRLRRLRTTRPATMSDAGQLFKTPTVVQEIQYTYDPMGNITSIKDDALRRVVQNGQTIDPHNDFTYDSLYRLIKATGREHVGQDSTNRPEHRSDLKPHYDFNDATRMHPNDPLAMRKYSQSFEYDAAGNIRKVVHSAGGSGWTREHVYAVASNRLLRTTLPGNNNFADYQHDALGRISRMPHLSLLRWDFEDRLHATAAQVRLDGGTAETTYYVYDADGQRVRKVVENQSAPGSMPTIKNERIYLPDFEVYREYTGGSITLERETLHVMDASRRVALVETRTRGTDQAPQRLLRYQIDNHLQSSAIELDSGAKLISFEEHYSFGSTSFQATGGQNETPKRYRYCGKERDEETGLHYHGARYYASWLGRWVSCDPKGIAGGMCLYEYARNNPIKFVDLDGKEPALAASPAPSLPPWLRLRPPPGFAANDNFIPRPGVGTTVGPSVARGGVSGGGLALWAIIIGIWVSPYLTVPLPEEKPYVKPNGRMSVDPKNKMYSDRDDYIEGGPNDPNTRQPENKPATDARPDADTSDQPADQPQSGKKTAPVTRAQPNYTPDPRAATKKATEPDPCEDCSKENWRRFNPRFMAEKLNQILSNRNHPLGFLVDYETGTWKARTTGKDVGVHAGHRIGRRGCEWEYGKLRLALERGWENIWDADTESAAAISKPTVIIEGVEVDLDTARQWQQEGKLQGIDLNKLPRSEGWKPSVCQ